MTAPGVDFTNKDAFAPPGAWVQGVSNSGERYLPLVRPYHAAMHLGHMAGYRAALPYSYGRRVLDLGCGLGYGAFFLAGYGAKQVVGLDLSHTGLTYAGQVYHHPRLNYLTVNALQLPFKDASFNFIFSSQVIEHLPSAETFLIEIKRLLAPDGLCMIITPNKALFSPSGHSGNPHHLSELDWTTFRSITQAVFSSSQFYGIPQRCLTMPEGQTIPVIKANADIRPADYRLQTGDLEACENMVCLGAAGPNGNFSPGLPDHLRAAADESGPIFWDASISKWVVMGLYPADTPTAAISLFSGHTLTQVFDSPRPNLYRLEVDLITPAGSALAVSLQRRSGNPNGSRLAETIRPVKGKLVWTFPPQPDSAGERYALTIQLASTIPNLLRWVKSFKFRAAPGGPNQVDCLVDEKAQGAPLSLRTFHDCLPASSGSHQRESR
jgi:ubiquinone/menaquinone biosynthesis C-methylase UbiE